MSLIAMLMGCLVLVAPGQDESKSAARAGSGDDGAVVVKAEAEGKVDPKSKLQDGAKGAPPKPPEQAGRGTSKLPKIPKVRRAGPTIPNYRVALRTKGDRKFTGIVTRDLRFHNHVRAGEHHERAIYDSPEKFTLSYVDGLDGEVRLAWNKVAKLEVKEVLDLVGMKQMEEARSGARVVRLQQARRRSELRRQQQEEAAREGESGETPPAADPAKKEGVVGETTPPADDGRPALLKTYAPEDGWGLAKKENLEWRRTVLGLFPTEFEQAFLDQYDEWSEAFVAWSSEHGTEGESGEGEGESEETPPEKGSDKD